MQLWWLRCPCSRSNTCLICAKLHGLMKIYYLRYSEQSSLHTVWLQYISKNPHGSIHITQHGVGVQAVYCTSFVCCKSQTCSCADMQTGTAVVCDEQHTKVMQADLCLDFQHQCKCRSLLHHRHLVLNITSTSDLQTTTHAEQFHCVLSRSTAYPIYVSSNNTTNIIQQTTASLQTTRL